MEKLGYSRATQKQANDFVKKVKVELDKFWEKVRAGEIGNE